LLARLAKIARSSGKRGRQGASGQSALARPNKKQRQRKQSSRSSRAGEPHSSSASRSVTGKASSESSRGSISGSRGTNRSSNSSNSGSSEDRKFAGSPKNQGIVDSSKGVSSKSSQHKTKSTSVPALQETAPGKERKPSRRSLKRKMQNEMAENGKSKKISKLHSRKKVNGNAGNGVTEDALLTTPLSGFTVNRGEMIRLMLQSLRDLGMDSTATTLEKESGISEENTELATVEKLILVGKWKDAGQRLIETLSKSTAQNMRKDFDRVVRRCQVLLAQEKFYELILRGQFAASLECLRDEISPIFDRKDTARYANLILCEDLDAVHKILGRTAETEVEHRAKVVERLRELLPQSLVLPRQRLLTLVDYGLQEQLRQLFPPGSSKKVQSDISRMPLAYDLSEAPADVNRVPTRVIQRIVVHGTNCQIWSVQFSHDGLYIACGGTDRRVRVYSVRGNTKKDPAERKQGVGMQNGGSDALTLHPYVVLHGGPVTRLAWSPDDTWLAAGDDKGHILLWDGLRGNAPNSAPAFVFRNFRKRVTGLCWVGNTNSRLLASSIDIGIVLYDTIDGAILAQWGGYPVYDFVFSNAQRLLVAACGGTKECQGHHKDNFNSRRMRVFSVETNETGRKFRLRDFSDACKANSFGSSKDCDVVVSMTLSRDEETLVTTFENSNLTEWSMKTGMPQRTYIGADCGNATMRSSLGGFCENLLATGTIDGQICIWDRARPAPTFASFEDTKDSPPLLTLGNEHVQPVNSVAWSPVDPSLLVSVSDDGLVLLWSWARE